MRLAALRTFAIGLPHTTFVKQWGECLVFKVAGKMFLIIALDAELADAVVFKCDPADFDALTEMGDQNYLATTAYLLAEAVRQQGRTDEALELARLDERDQRLGPREALRPRELPHRGRQRRVELHIAHAWAGAFGRERTRQRHWPVATTRPLSASSSLPSSPSWIRQP